MSHGLLIGVDAGGTSTKALALDLETGEQRTARTEGANWTVHGPDLCRQRLGAAVAEAAGGRPIHSLALCIAGYYPPDHAEAAQAWARAAWPEAAHLTLQPDVHAAWAGAFGGEPGIVVISGTGSIAYGRNASGEEARAGGWGPLFGDFGSAYHAGRLALQTMSWDVDWGDRPDRLGRSLLKRWPELGSDPTSWLRGVYRHNWQREEVAAVGGFVAEYADRGDLTSWSIIEEMAGQLAEQAQCVNRALGSATERGRRPRVALQGSFGEKCQTLRRLFQKVCDERAKESIDYRLALVESRFGPLEGAAILAAKQAGLPQPPMARVTDV